MSKVKNMFFGIILLMILTGSAFAQNPSNYYKWVKTTNDTITIGLAGNKILSVSNRSFFPGDSISVYIPFSDGTFSGYPFKIGRLMTNSFSFYGNKIIVKSNVDSVMINYTLGDVNVFYHQSKFTIIDSILAYTSHPFPQFRDTITFRDTLTSITPFKTYSLGCQYTLITVALTRGDTNRVVMDSVNSYSLSTYGDTAQVGMRNLKSATDVITGVVGTAANTIVGFATNKYLVYDPITKFLHIRMVNAVLTGRIVILTLRAVRQ